MPPAFTGVVLCGGRSRRMGRDKALVRIDGVAMARRVADALAAAGAVEVVALGGDLPSLAAVGLRARPDAHPGEGPFPATLQALRLAPTEVVVVLSCDLVAPSGDAVRALVGRLAACPDADVAVPVVDDHHQWTHAAWRRRALIPLVAAREAGTTSLKRAAPGLVVAEVHDLSAAHLADADVPADLPAGAGTLLAMDLPEVDVHQLAALRETGVPLIDVREDDEYLDARVPGATHIPLGEVPDRVGEVPTEGPLYVICARGGRSAKAAEHYRSLGIDAINVAGGTLAWIDAGLPTDSGPGRVTRPGSAPITDFRWVGDAAAFEEVLAELAGADLYTLDTEFHRERTYHARLALLQLGWPGGIVLVDPLAVDVAPLGKVLDGPGRCVMHAASQDLEILARVCGTVPADLFDTQTAAGFLGYSSVGLAGLLQAELDVTVPKADRLTDWLARPLPDGATAYAASDVAHLHHLHDQLVEKLEERGRLQWALDECEVQRSRSVAPQVPERAWWRIKEARSLRGRAAAVAQALAAWRERRAAEVDRPVRFLLADLALVSMAQRPPSSEADLGRVRGLDEGKRKGGAAKELLGAVAAGVDLPLEDVQVPPAEGVDRSRRAAASLVSAWAAQRARDLEIDAAILATRSDIESLLMGDGGRLASGWRHDVMGEPMRALAAGEASLALDPNGRLVLERRSGDPL